MNRLRFTPKRVAELSAPDRGRTYYYDEPTPGLCVMVTDKGARSYYVYRKVNGRPIRVRLGGTDELSLEHARKRAFALMGGIAEGKDPQAEKVARRSEMTLGELFTLYLEQHAKPHKRSWKSDQENFDRYLADWKNRKLSSIRRAEVQALHGRLGERIGHHTANRVRSLIHTLFAKALDLANFDKPNPAHGVQRFKEQSRARFLQPDELPAFWESLSQEPQLFQDFFMLALLTGARRRNVEAMRWEDVNLAAACWRLTHTKNNEPLLLHLPSKAVQILRRRQHEANGSPWVFPTWSKLGHLVEPKTAWSRILKRAGLVDLRMHDLRRTLGSWQALAGTSLQVIGASLGHKSLQATQVYSRLTMQPVIASVDTATGNLLAAMKPKKSRKAAANGKAK